MQQQINNVEVKRNIILLALFMLGYLSKYVFNVFLARHFDPISYGDINIIFKIVNLAVPLLILGLNNSMLRFIPPLLANGNRPGVSLFLSLVFRVLCITSVAAIGVGVVLGCAAYFTGHSALVGLHYPGILASFLLPFAALIVVFNSLLKCYERFYFTVFSSTTLSFLLSLALLTCAFYIYNAVNFYAAFSMILVSYVMLAVIQLGVLYKPMRGDLRSKNNTEHANPRWIPVSLFFMLSTLVYSSLLSIDLILLEILSHNQSEVGFFSALLTVAWSVFMVSQASTVIFNAKISSYYQAGEKDALQQLLSTAFMFNLVLGIVFVLLIVLFGRTFLHTFGSDYAHLYPELVFLTVGAFFINIMQTPSSMLVFTDYCDKAVVINVFSLVIAIAVDVVFIPKYGMNGAMISLIAVGVLSNLYKAILVKRFLQLKPFIFV